MTHLSRIGFGHRKETQHQSSGLGGPGCGTETKCCGAAFLTAKPTEDRKTASARQLDPQRGILASLKERPGARRTIKPCNPDRMLGFLVAQVVQGCRTIFFRERASRDTQGTYQETLSFMGLVGDNRDKFERVNEAKKAKSRFLQYIVARGGPARRLISGPIKKLTGKSSLGVLQGVKNWNNVKAGPLDIPLDLQEEIAAHYADDMAHVGELPGKDLSALGWPVAK